MSNYRLKGTKLSIVQGLNARKQIDLAQIKTSILQEVYADVAKGDTANTTNKKPVAAPMPAKTISPDSVILKELKVIYPTIKSFGVGKMIVYSADKLSKDTVETAIAAFKTKPAFKETLKLQSLLRLRYQSNKLKLIVQ